MLPRVEHDAEALPYPDASFDLVASLIGAMFAPQPERVTAELLRVCRPGGRIVMANWTPEGFVGQMFKVIARHAPPSPLMAPPVQWGQEAIVRERLGHGTTRLDVTRRMYPMRYPFSPADVVEFFRVYYGPTDRAFAGLDPARQDALRHELEQLWSSHNQAERRHHAPGRRVPGGDGDSQPAAREWRSVGLHAPHYSP